ncbi:hypothetical protein G6514_000991 [Epicoccum nigrum]|nr:hypothetical protein G6514_000991 [Epicoccum nigrum]
MAGQSHTHTANRQAFYRHRIIPRMLVDTNKRDTKTSIFGHQVNAPIGFAPVGINRIYHPQGELPVARAAGGLGLPYALSTTGSQPIEDVGAANDALTRSFLQRAVDSGFTACILTLDTWQLGWRHDDVATSNYAFYHGQSADLGLSDPVFQQRLEEAGYRSQDPAQRGGRNVDRQRVVRARAYVGESGLGDETLESVGDARKAVEYGFDGIVVSNHAGRQVDGAVASLDAMEKIVEVVGDKTYVMYDSGIRSASDVIKALALGAQFV